MEDQKGRDRQNAEDPRRMEEIARFMTQMIATRSQAAEARAQQFSDVEKLFKRYMNEILVCAHKNAEKVRKVMHAHDSLVTMVESCMNQDFESRQLRHAVTGT